MHLYYNAITISLYLLPLTSKFSNISKLAHAGDKVTISPGLATSLALQIASLKFSANIISKEIFFSFNTHSKTSFILYLVAPTNISVLIFE